MARPNRRLVLVSGATLAAAIWASPVPAQTGGTPTIATPTPPSAVSRTPPAGDPVPVPAGISAPGAAGQPSDTLLRLSSLKGVGVIGSDHTKVGDIEDVLVDHEGRAKTVVIGVGGFLGLGEKRVAVPFGSVLWNTRAGPDAGPSASLNPANAGPAPRAPEQAADASPGQNVPNESLRAANDQQQTGGTGSGPQGTDAGDRADTLVVNGSRGRVEHAEVRLSKGDLQGAPEFKYEGSGR